MKTLSVHRDGAVVEVRLERPDTLNAQTHEMWFELRQVAADLGQDSSIRALIVSGAGRSFSAGLDTAVIADFFGGATAPDLEGLEAPDYVRTLQSSFTWLKEAPFPTIAAVQGHALGAGFQLALACDLRIAGDDATFALLESTWGLMPDLGATVWLPELIGPSRALELMWLADRLDAVHAERLGLVNRVVPTADLHAEARAMADRLAAQPPIAVTAIKEAVRAGLGDKARGFVVAGEGQARCLFSSDLREAAAARLEGRRPSYTGT
ncbi:enoyl-CoA hydratase/isomerase family protein [Iamia sp. SCSIO 61187]|uniref:enoyl-CoA hydratase/isomerase family protein n=1 Tax=Iamia sp. SCSIO 61187 TaxID=2722752 RepID=UPI001C6359D6|nr:enoyl-CoA hydratase/isomerase family protein [Iamia sp. SCSIO 61187]